MPRAMPSANAANRLMEHYLGTARSLPWRVPPGGASPDPYRIWLSEVMLQQTTVAAVAPRFERFIARWPTVEQLAAAPDDEILAEWAGLGYYARARNLIACARQITASGGFPPSEAGLRLLPGIGDYTAASIAAIAFGERVPVVDTNVRRVVSRLFAIAQPSASELRERVEAMIPDGRPGDFAQAMMDLGATVCRPTEPLCAACPLVRDCAAFALGAAGDYPAAKPKRAKPLRYGTAHWIERDGHVRLVRRPSKGLLGGMAALPGPEWTGEQPGRQASLGTVRHIFTHFALELTIVASNDPSCPGWWQPLGSLADAGLPTLYRKAVDAVLSARALDAAA